jgi:hypothetical protein
MSLLEKVKTGAQQAAGRTREELQELQTKRELNQVYSEVGEKLCELVERGETVHVDLAALVERARALKVKLGAEKTV